MPFYSMGFLTTATATGAPVLGIRAPTNAIKVWEIALNCKAATASGLVLYRNTNGSYAASTSTSVGQAEDPTSHAGTGLLDTAWSAAPTITAASKMRYGGAPAAIGAGWIWTSRAGIGIRAATATDILVLWNESGSAISAMTGHVVWEE